MEDLQLRLSLLIVKLSYEFRERKPCSETSYRHTLATLLKLAESLKSSSPHTELCDDFVDRVAQALQSKDQTIFRVGVVAANSLDTVLDLNSLLRLFKPEQHAAVKEWQEALFVPRARKQVGRRFF